MDNGTSNGSIVIAPALRPLLDELAKKVEIGKEAERMLLAIAQGILWHGGAQDGLHYTRSNDGAQMVPAQITLTGAELQALAAEQANRNQ